MKLATNGPSALAIIRALRCGVVAGGLPKDRCQLDSPSPEPHDRWSRKVIDLGPYANLLEPGKGNPLHVVVPSKAERLRMNSVKNTVVESGLASDSFVPLGNGLSVPCPELLFLEMDKYMEPLPQLMLGLELCGTFSRDPKDPLGGRAVLGIEPVTSAERIRDYLERSGIRGHGQSVELAGCLADGSWSPGEALVAAWAALPFTELGYGLGPVALNDRVRADGDLAHFAAKDSRVPDMLLAGEKVGINYDGEGHLDLGRVIEATAELGRNPGSSDVAKGFETARHDVREKYVDDRRRDRELSAAGLTVFVATKEDLYEPGGLDKLMGQCMVALRNAGVEGLEPQIATIRNKAVAGMRRKMLDAVLVGRGRKGILI